MKKLFLIGFAVVLFIVLWNAMSTDKPAVSSEAIESPVKALTPEEIAANKKAGEKTNLEIRKAYETSLRNSYLDKGLDIKVDVKGKKSDILELHYALFNDVWLRKLETSGTLDEWHKMGFKKIVITDGYDYNQEVAWKN